MSSILRLVLTVSLVHAPRVTLAQAQGDSKEKEQEAKAKIAEFKKAVSKAKKPDEIIDALKILEDCIHPKAMKECAAYLGHADPGVQMTAADNLGKYRGVKEAADELIKALGNESRKLKKNKQNKDEGHEVAVHFCKTIAKIGVKASAAGLHPYFKHRQNLTFTAEVIKAAGFLKNLDTVDQLLALSRELDTYQQELDSTGTGSAIGPQLPGLPNQGNLGTADRSEKSRLINTLRPAVNEALQRITGQAAKKSTRDWETWWNANKEKLRKAEKEAEKKS